VRFQAMRTGAFDDKKVDFLSIGNFVEKSELVATIYRHSQLLDAQKYNIGLDRKLQFNNQADVKNQACFDVPDKYNLLMS
jgi:hypothetical protein